MYDDPLRSAFTSVGPAPAVPDDVPTDADAIAAFFGGAEYVPPAPSDGDVGHASTLEAVAALYASENLVSCIAMATALLEGHTDDITSALSAEDRRFCIITRCKALIAMGDPNAALVQLQTFESELVERDNAHQASVDATLCHADALSSLGRADEACELLHSFSLQSGLEESARRRILSALVVHYLRAQRFESALSTADVLQLELPSCAASALLRVRALLKSAQLKRAEAALHETSRLELSEPQQLELHTLQAIVLLSNGDLEDAVTTLEGTECVAVDPVVSEVLSVALLHQNELDRAVAVLEDCIRFDPRASLQPALVAQLALLYELWPNADLKSSLHLLRLLANQYCPDRILPALSS